MSAKVGPLDTWEFFRFASVGFLNVAVSFVVFLFFFKVAPVGHVITILASGATAEGGSGVTHQDFILPDAGLATALGYLAGMVNSFFLNKHWTFKAKGNTRRQMQRFVAVNAVGLSVSSLSLFVFVDLLAWPYGMIWFVTTGLVMVLNYYGSRHWAFAR